jgi:organic radical activating enzyme
MNNFNHIPYLYWVFTHVCNDHCDHCYNSSGPQGDRMSDDECLSIIDNLPPNIDRLMLSGGEPLALRKQLYLIVDTLRDKYDESTKLTIQTNGDLLNGKKLDTLIEKGVNHIGIASIDRYHKNKGERKEILQELFTSRGMKTFSPDPKEFEALSDEEQMDRRFEFDDNNPLTYGFMGANEEFWLGGNWARGRAFENDLWMQDHTHNFCAMHSGAKGFLGGKENVQEISIQLWKVNPCCPGTKVPMGDARTERVADIIQRVSKSEIFQKLNEGDPWSMGESIGVSEEHALERGEKLQNVCLWCDEFFAKNFDMETLSAKNGNGVKESEDQELSKFEQLLKAQKRNKG